MHPRPPHHPPPLISPPLRASLQHGHQHLQQRRILQRRRHPLLIRQLLIDLLILAMRPRLYPNIDPEARREGLFETHADAETDDGGEGTVRDGGGDEDRDCDELVGGGEGGRGRDEDVGEVDDGEGAEGEGVFGVGDCGDEVWGLSVGIHPHLLGPRRCEADGVIGIRGLTIDFLLINRFLS